MNIVCFDMEGTLTPEIWEQVSIDSGIPELSKTTRDIPSYSDLMNYRIDIMRQNNLKLVDIVNATKKLEKKQESNKDKIEKLGKTTLKSQKKNAALTALDQRNLEIEIRGLKGIEITDATSAQRPQPLPANAQNQGPNTGVA